MNSSERCTSLALIRPLMGGRNLLLLPAGLEEINKFGVKIDKSRHLDPKGYYPEATLKLENSFLQGRFTQGLIGLTRQGKGQEGYFDQGFRLIGTAQLSEAPDGQTSFTFGFLRERKHFASGLNLPEILQGTTFKNTWPAPSPSFLTHALAKEGWSLATKLGLSSAGETNSSDLKTLDFKIKLGCSLQQRVIGGLSLPLDVSNIPVALSLEIGTMHQGAGESGAIGIFLTDKEGEISLTRMQIVAKDGKVSFSFKIPSLAELENFMSY